MSSCFVDSNQVVNRNSDHIKAMLEKCHISAAQMMDVANDRGV